MSYTDNTHDNKGWTLLREAMDAWDARATFRSKRARVREYLLGDQWSDMMEDPESGEKITEREYIESQGRLAIQNNLLRPIALNLVGQYRQVQPTPVAITRNASQSGVGDQITGGMRYALDINQATEVDAGELFECVLSGSFGWKTRFKWIPELDRADITIDPVDQTRLFFNPDVGDRRVNQLSLIGEIHDYSMEEVIADFAKNKDDEERFRDIYGERGPQDRYNDYYYYNPSDYWDHRDFLIAQDNHKHRVIELWKTEYRWENFVHDPSDGTTRYTEEDEYEIGLRNRARLDEAAMYGIPEDQVPLLDIEERFEPFWKVYYLSPFGDILAEFDTPYEHQLCPYDIGLYPYMDGETVGIMETIVDQQRQFNRLLSLLDQSIKMSNKGWWMIPRSALGEGEEKLTEEEFVKKTMTYGNYVFYDGSDPQAPKPQFFQGQSIPVGATEVANLQRDLMKEITGVLGSVQGAAPPANTPASLYAQQTANASTTQRDVFDYFNSRVQRRNRKVAMLQRQFYEERRNIKTASFNKSGFDHMYKPEDVLDIDFDVSLGESSNNVVYRQMIDSYLLDFVTNGLITFEDFLETTSLPFADVLLERIKQRQEAMAAQQGGMAGALPPGAEGQQGTPQQPQMPQQQPAGGAEAENIINQKLVA